MASTYKWTHYEKLGNPDLDGWPGAGCLLAQHGRRRRGAGPGPGLRAEDTGDASGQRRPNGATTELHDLLWSTFGGGSNPVGLRFNAA